MRHYQLSESVLVKTIQSLSKFPYEQVAETIAMLQQDAKPIEEQKKEVEKKK